MFRRYWPPTSNSAFVIWPSEQTARQFQFVLDLIAVRIAAMTSGSEGDISLPKSRVASDRMKTR